MLGEIGVRERGRTVCWVVTTRRAVACVCKGQFKGDGVQQGIGETHLLDSVHGGKLICSFLTSKDTRVYTLDF